MGYLRYLDYQKSIQDANFQQIIASNDAFRISMEHAAQAEVISYLVQKYDVKTEFKDTRIYSGSATYSAGSLVSLSGYYAAWSVATASYSVNSYVSYTDGNVYRCIQITTGAHEVPIDINFWAFVGTINDLFYIENPYPLFDIANVYLKGDFVFWKDKIYSCLVPTTTPTHSSDLQDGKISNIPLYNIFPDDKINGKINWGTGIPYSVTGLIPNAAPSTAWVSGAYTAGQRVSHNGLTWKALLNNSVEPGIDITNWQSETWVSGDNRNAQLVRYMVAITIRYLSDRLAFRNIPEQWKINYTEAKQWLQDAAEGVVTADLPLLQPLQGSRIRSGGNVKNKW